MTRRKRPVRKQEESRTGGPDHPQAPGRDRRRLLVVGLAAATVAAAALGAVVFAARRFFPMPWSRSGPSPAQQEAARSDPLRAEAFSLADRVVCDFPDNPEAIYARGLILNRFGSEAEAVRCWQDCLEREPRFAPAFYCLGRNAFDQGQYEKCIALMKQAMDAEPGMWDALVYTGRAEMSLGNVQNAIDALRQYVEQSPRSTEGHFRLGQAYLHADRPEEAAECFRAALAIDPKCKHAHYRMAQVYRRLGEEQRARLELQRFDELDTERARAGRGMRRDYDDQAAMRENMAHIHTVVAKVYAAYGDPGKAEEHFRRAAELDPTRAGQRR